jgi:hypothetical protein
LATALSISSAVSNGLIVRSAALYEHRSFEARKQQNFEDPSLRIPWRCFINPFPRDVESARIEINVP